MQTFGLAITSASPVSGRACRGRASQFIGGLAVFALWIGVGTAQGAEVRRLTFAELSACPLVADAADPRLVAEMPAALRAAKDGRVRLTGYMLPLIVERGRTRQFLLMRNQNACCFGQMPAANEFLIVDAAAPGLPVRMDLPLSVEGRLRIAPVVSGGAVVQFYNLEETVIAASGR